MKIKTVEYPADLLNGITSAPGRVRSYLKQEGEKKLLAHSCSLTVHKDLYETMYYTSHDLRGGSGVKLILDGFQKTEGCKFNWFFYLNPSHPDFSKITPHQQSYSLSNEMFNYYCHRPNTRLIVVNDSMEDDKYGVMGVTPIIEAVSIEHSWEDFIKYAKDGRDIIVDLSNLRPNGHTNSLGLVATGAVGDGSEDSNESSFLAIYEYLANHLKSGDILSFLQLFGVVNATVKKGGQYRNGIITSSMIYTNPNFKDYMLAPLVDIPGSHKKGVRLDEGLFDYPELVALIVDKRNTESIFFEKIDKSNPDSSPTFLNVCVTGDTWVNTTDGAVQVKDLIGKPFIAKVNGNQYPSTSKGFWSNGIKEVVKLQTSQGFELTLTPNHKVIKMIPKYKNHKKGAYIKGYSEEWVEVGTLKEGDKIRLNDNRYDTDWNGKGSFDEGWLMGNLVGDGSFTVHNQATLDFHGQYKDKFVTHCLERFEKAGFDLEKVRQYDYEQEGRIRIRSIELGKQAIHEYGILPKVKEMNFVEACSSDFYKGFLQGFFDADGSVIDSKSKNTRTRAVVLGQSNLERLKIAQRMLLRLGIKSYILENNHPEISKFVKNTGETVLIPKDKTKKPYSLYITGENMMRFAEKVNFSMEYKREKLLKSVNSFDKRSPNIEKFAVTVESITPAGFEEVYDCTIQEVHCFEANGILAHNCVGIELNDRGTCLIWRVNLAQCEVQDIPKAFIQATEYLCKLHTEWRSQVGDKANIYRPLGEDRQVGLDVLGFSNLLSQEGVTYREFRDALKAYLEYPFLKPANVSPDAWEITGNLAVGYVTSTIAADEFMDSKGLPRLDRIHTVEPAQSHSFELKDRLGYTTCRGIFPPFGRKQRRKSDSQKTKIFNHGQVETLVEVGDEVYWEVLELWQQLMQKYGRPHAISSDTIVECSEDWLKNFVLNSPLKSAYYAFHNEFDQEYLRKVANTAMTEEQLICSIENGSECSVCSE